MEADPKAVRSWLVYCRFGMILIVALDFDLAFNTTSSGLSPSKALFTASASERENDSVMREIIRGRDWRRGESVLAKGEGAAMSEGRDMNEV